MEVGVYTGTNPRSTNTGNGPGEERRGGDSAHFHSKGNFHEPEVMEETRYVWLCVSCMGRAWLDILDDRM